MGRKNKYGEETIPTTFRIPKSKVKEITDYVNAKLDSYVLGEVEKSEPVAKVKKVVPEIKKTLSKEEKDKIKQDKLFEKLMKEANYKPKSSTTEFKDTIPEIRTVNFPDECPNCRFTTVPKSGLRLRMTMCLKCKAEKKLNKNK